MPGRDRNCELLCELPFGAPLKDARRCVEDQLRVRDFALTKSAAGNVLNPSSRAEMISVGAVIFPNGNFSQVGTIDIDSGDAQRQGSMALTMFTTRSCSTLGEAATNTCRTPTNRIAATC
jgi:hypothetical protein